MAVVIRQLIDWYKYTREDLADPRTDPYFIVASPYAVPGIIATYLYLVLYLGPRIMKNRQPFNIDKLLVIYNTVQIIWSAYIFILGAKSILYLFSVCALPDYSMSEQAQINFSILLMYYLAKISDLLDTVFFVMRKKDNQITFLHVYHHATMVLWSWIGIRFVAGGTTLYVPTVNSFIHVIMYGYYLLTVWDKSFRDNILLKKHITELQLVQFLIIIAVFGSSILRTDCVYPTFTALLIVKENVFFFVLFADFYYRTYITKKVK